MSNPSERVTRKSASRTQTAASKTGRQDRTGGPAQAGVEPVT
jgi:hypothetical protein